MSNRWIGFDLDGTLAKYDHWRGVEHIGQPIEPMIDLAKTFINNGTEVRVFTARMGCRDPDEIKVVEKTIADWTEKHGLGRLKATCSKDYGMVTCFDDRCIQVIGNTGILLQDEYNILLGEKDG